MNLSDRIYVAGHRGMVGSAICRRLGLLGYRDVVTAPRDLLDLRDRGQIEHFFDRRPPAFLFLAAALVGGIGANVRSPADFISANLEIQTNVIQAAHDYGVKRLLFLGSSCIYPREAAQPIAEDALLTGPLEETNRAYAVAKIAGLELLRAYKTQHDFDSVSVMPTNLYGPGDNFEPYTSHVVPGIMRRMHRAKILGENVTLWGTGTPRRELLHVDDCASVCVDLMRMKSPPALVNVGTGEDLPIAELAALIAQVVGFTGRVLWDPMMPDGTLRKLLDVSLLQSLGLHSHCRRGLRDGLTSTYAWFLEHQETCE